MIEAALRLFRERGYEATTVEQIAEAADVAKGTFFNYFETKEAILPALVEWRLQALETALEPGQGAPASPTARIHLALRLVAEDPLADPTLARQILPAMMRQGQLPEHRPGRALNQLLSELVQQAQAAGEIRSDIDASLIACVIMAAFFQQVMLWRSESRSLPQALDQTMDMILNGIASPRQRTRQG